MAQKLKILDGRVENIVGKGENAGYQHFLLFPQCFQKSLLLGVVKSSDSVAKNCPNKSMLFVISSKLFSWLVSTITSPFCNTQKRK